MGPLYFQCSKRRSCAAAIALVAIGLGSLTLLPATSAFADGGDQAAAYAGADQQIDLDIVNANLLSVVSMLRMKSGAQIVVVGSDQGYRPVTVTVSGSLSTVLRYVAVSACATVSKNSDGVYIFRPASNDAAPSQSNPAPDTDDSASTASMPTRAIGPMHVEKIALKNVSPDFILIMLNEQQGMRDTNPYHNAASQETFSPIPGAKDFQGNIITSDSNINLLGGNGQSEQSSVPLNNGAIGANSSMTANRSSNDSGSQAQQYVTQGGGGFQFGGDQGNNGGFGNGGGFGGRAPGAFGAGATGANGQQQPSLKPDGIDSIIANEEDNSLLVRGDAQGIAELKQIISLLDIPPKQVQIKVEYITANVTDVNTFGISWDLLPFPSTEVGTTQGSSLQTAGDTFLSYAHGNLVANLYAYLSEGKGKNISSPIITTTNNTPAKIYENIQIPYVTTTTVAGSTGGAVSNAAVNFLNVPTGLSVIPRVNGDNSVTLQLEPTVEVPGTSVIANGPPPVTSEGLTTIRTVANGETMVLGGLVSKNDTNETTKVPILGDLPIIGGLFRTKNENINNSELLIFVTPTVLPAPGATASLSGASSGSDTSGVGVTP